MGEMVRKASTEEIINHWMLAISCILLIITGYAFLFKLEQIGAVFGGFNGHEGRAQLGRRGIHCLLVRDVVQLSP